MSCRALRAAGGIAWPFFCGAFGPSAQSFVLAAAGRFRLRVQCREQPRLALPFCRAIAGMLFSNSIFLP